MITRVLAAQPAPVVVLNPERTRLLILEPAATPSTSDPQQLELGVAGLLLNPRNTAPTGLRTFTAMISRPIGRGETRRIIIPWKASVAHPMWSPNGEKIAFSVVEEAGISLWVAEAWSGESRMLAGPILNGAFGNPCQWLSGGDGLLCLKAATALSGSVDRYLSSQLVTFSLSGTERPVGTPGHYAKVQLSPDNRYLLVESLHQPFPPGVPPDRLPTRTELWDLSGALVRLIAERGVAELPPRPADGVPPGSRNFDWRSDAPATLVWTESLDGANSSGAVPVRDRLFQLEAPFGGIPLLLLELQGRIVEAAWGRDDLAIVTERSVSSGQTRLWVINPSVVGGAPQLVSERATDDRSADPGRFLFTHNSRGRPILQTSKDGRFAFLAGIGASAMGEKPFLDRLELPSRKLFRMWRSDGAYYEEAIALLDRNGDRLITRRESVNEPPNYFIRDLRKPGIAKLSPLTEFKDPSPEFSGMTRQLLSFRRADGVAVSAMLYLPPGYRPIQGRLPFVLWAGSQDFGSVRNASLMASSPHRFVRSPDAPFLFFLLSGYGVLHAPALPIVAAAGSGTSNRARGQLVAGATAAVERLVAMGLADPNRMGVGGDSAGSEVAVSLLEHSTLFRAGVAEARVEGDSAGRTILFRPADGVRRPLLTLLPGPGGKRTRESIGRMMQESISWMDRYLKAPSKTP